MQGSFHELFILALLGPCVATGGLSGLRTDTVKSSFDPTKADGLWYEIAFKDAAQVGCSCQTVSNRYDSHTGNVAQNFSTRYGLIPLTLAHTYEPDKSGEKGVYSKYLNGASTVLRLPTVVVDVADGEDGKYSLMTEFTSKDLLVTITEIRFLARTPTVSSDTLRQMKAVASSVGIPRSVIDSVKVVDHTGCPSLGMSAQQPASESVSDDALILKPPAGKTGTPAAWIVLPGAEIDKSTYRALAEEVQRRASMPLWVAVLGTALTPTPIPPELGPRIDFVLNTMKGQGLDPSRANVFYGGHSLGSVFIQDHLYKYHGSKGPMGGKIKVLGQVLMGGFIQRKYNWPTKTYPVTTLTVGGELDGLARCTRLAEAFYTADGEADFPVVIVPGMTHMQFASGDPPMLVKARDLQPEISYDEAHSAVAEIVASYFEKLAGVGDGSAVTRAVKSTGDFATPIIAAYELEGARYFNAPAQYGGPLQKTCVKGGCDGKSQWAPKAQEMISSVDGWKLSVTNQYVDVSSTPLTGEVFHLPDIRGDNSTNTISITTYSQSSWERLDQFDTGFVATSAAEIATKLASRQCTLIQGLGEANTSFSVDDPQFCAQTNAQAYKWAQEHAGPSTMKRFKQYGQRYTFSDDIPKSGGPLFIDAWLQFNEVVDAHGEKVISVSAPMQKTEIDYWKNHFGPLPRPSSIPDPGCFHYCKLLSPARAMEWLYVDSLRLKRSLDNSTEASSKASSRIQYV